MTEAATKKEFVTFSPNLRADDACANYWMQQVTIRLRREVWWSWHERGLQPANATANLPPFSDRLSTTLDLSRFWAEKQEFYKSDATASYLTEQLLKKPPRRSSRLVRGSFCWVAETLGLDDVSRLVLALGTSVALDASMCSVISACLNDPSKSLPNLALAQRLWDDPKQVLAIADPFHPLFRYGLIKYSGQHLTETLWDAPLTVSSLVARQLLFPQSAFPSGLTQLESLKTDDEPTEAARLAALKLSVSEPNALRLVPVIGAKGSAQREIVRSIATLNGKSLVELESDAPALDDNHYLNSIATVCWLRDTYVFLGKEPPSSAARDQHRVETYALPAATIPATFFLALTSRTQLSQFPANLTLPAVKVPAATYEERLECWKQNLTADVDERDSLVAECARRFRFERETIRAVCKELNQAQGKITREDLFAACRAELNTGIGELAGRVIPRFTNEELILPPKQDQMFHEIYRAMTTLTEVHYGWGTAKAWNEGGISVLFAGPPGTGKTMAAEILAIKLDLPMYRIDLSQVVNKYIGETEKNLKRVFDAADVSDMILFFDEADSLFGRRTEVSDAHDRYANLEISYLLERMERFKGLAILATNRKKDLDEAFLRRLRYIVDFPLPEVEERKKIWQQVVPEHADASELEFDFLASKFPLSGGNIRSIVFNACLQSADGSGLNSSNRRLSMKDIIIAVKREYDKSNRTLSPQQYGAYASLIEQLDRD
jgi:ATPase family associated with various cellular activities (AAA)